MFSFIGKLFGSTKSVNKTIDTISNGLDKLVYTDEEKAEVRAASISEARRVLVDWTTKTTGQNLTRRFIAVSITLVWLFFYLSSFFIDISALIFTEQKDLLIQISGQMEVRADQMQGAIMLILGFYFAAPHMSSIVGVAMKKFEGNKK